MAAIRFGVCGIGRIGVQHCRVFSQNREHYELVALCDLDAARVSAITAELGEKGLIRSNWRCEPQIAWMGGILQDWEQL